MAIKTLKELDDEASNSSIEDMDGKAEELMLFDYMEFMTPFYEEQLKLYEW